MISLIATLTLVLAPHHAGRLQCQKHERGDFAVPAHALIVVKHHGINVRNTGNTVIHVKLECEEE